MNQDLNSPVLIAHLFDAAKVIAADQKDPNILGRSGAAELLNAMRTWMFDILGLAPEAQSGSTKYQKALDAAMSVVLDVRRKARESKDWSTSDALRDALAQGGIVVQDGPEGSSFRVE